MSKYEGYWHLNKRHGDGYNLFFFVKFKILLKENASTQTNPSMKENIVRIYLMDLGNINGQMVINLKVIGILVN